jgi:hypothetical protein
VIFKLMSNTLYAHAYALSCTQQGLLSAVSSVVVFSTRLPELPLPLQRLVRGLRK